MKNERKNIDLPKISIITVNKNNAESLEKTIHNVLGQDYQNLEYIIIDGNSSDKSLSLIKKYDFKIAHWISEDDNGIYDAMNKGVKLATGEYICFINSGDFLYSKDTVKRVSKYCKENYDLIYGTVCDIIDEFTVSSIEDYSNFKLAVKHNPELRKAINYRIIKRNKDTLWMGHIFCHQTLFARKKLLLKYPFNTKKKIVSDFEFVYKAYNESAKMKKMKLVIAAVQRGGLSDQSFLKRTFERWSFIRKYKNDMEMNKYYLKLFISGLKKSKTFR